jgi:hypothetical protein
VLMPESAAAAKRGRACAWHSTPITATGGAMTTTTIVLARLSAAA